MKRVFICSDSVTGIFSAIYDAWKLRPRKGEVGIALRGMTEQELFCEYEEVAEDERKTLAVEKMIRKHLGEETYWHLYHAMLSNDEKKGEAVLGTMLEARELLDSTKIMNHLADDSVRKVFELSRMVGNEAHYYKEFLRFRELANGVLFAKINPKYKILTCIADHFSDRLSIENWAVYDEEHKMTLVHQAKKSWILLTGEEINLEYTQNYSQTEAGFEVLWREFCKTISIGERENRNLQRQHLPMRYRGNMVEFRQ